MACGTAPAPDALRLTRTETLVVAATAEPRSLLPPFAVDLVAGQLCDQLYQRLARPEPQGGTFSALGDAAYRPDLASSWTWSADSTRLRFTIDSRARWHDGHPVTSRDVVFTYAVHADTTAGVLRGVPRGLIDSVTADGTHAVVLWAARRTPSLFHRAIYPVHILPAHRLDTVPRRDLVAHQMNRAPLGSGVFRFERWAPGEYIALQRSTPERASDGDTTEADGADVRSIDEVWIRRLLLRIFPDQNAAINALGTGEADVVDFVRAEDIARLQASARVRLLELPALTYTVLQWNLRSPSQNLSSRVHPVLGDPRVRRALAMALDREDIVRNVLGRTGRTALGPVTRAQATSDSTLTLPAFDPDGARALLDSAGWRLPAEAARAVRHRRGRPLRFTLLVPTTSPPRRRAAIIVQAMLAGIGAEVRVEAIDNAALMTALQAGRFDAALVAFRVDPDPIGVGDVWGGTAARSGDGFNFGRYDSAVTDTLLASAARAGDPVTQRRAYRQAYQRIIDDVPAVFLYEPVAVLAHADRLQLRGVRSDAWWAHLADWRLQAAAASRSRTARPTS